MRISEDGTFQSMSTAIGVVGIRARGGRIVGLHLPNAALPRVPAGGCASADKPLLVEAFAQLKAYLAGRLKVFDLPLETGGTPFQREVWEALRRVPYGKTASYAEIARAIGRPKAARAVGMANHANPIAIIIPCHRIIASGGGLGGYGGGLALKRRLLALEGLYFP